MRYLPVLVLLLAVGCAGIPQGVEPIGDFELDRYLGKWYEIARLDHPFERGLTNVTAEYSLRDDSDVRVLNRGYSEAEGAFQEAEGRARFAGPEDVGYLEVSFFGPFFGSYIIIELDKEGYQYALICGPDRSYLWILARTPELDEDVLTMLVDRAAALNFDTDALIYVTHDEAPTP